MADVTEIQGRIQANAEELKMTLESALQNAGAALGGMADVLEEAKTRSQVQLERLTAEKEELQQTGRDVSIKTREVLTEQKKLDVLAKGISVGSVFKNVGQIQTYLEEFRKGGQSMTDVMGDTGKELLDFAENILSKKQFSELKDAFEKHADPMTPDELKKHEEAITKHLAGITVAGKDIAAMMARMEDFNASRANAELDKLNKQTHALLEKWFGLKEQEKSFFTLLGLHGEAGFKEVAGALQSVVTPMNLMTLAMTKVIGLTKRLVSELDQLYSNLAKSGGLVEAERGGMFGGTIESAVHQNRALGIGKEESFSANAGLQQSYSQFSTLGEDARADLTATAAQLQVVGVSAQTTGKLMTAFTKQFGKSASESKDIILDMEEYGRSIGVTSSKMMEDMAAAMDTLSMFGEKSVQIFKELAKQAKKTGIEVATLVGLEEKFSTFDNTAELAGKINAMAGRIVLDPMQLMLATGEEKQALIQQAAQSMAINPNNARAIKYAADAFGISPAEFQKLANPNQDAPERKAASLKEVISMSISMGQKLKTILENIVVAAMPILTVLHTLLDYLAAGAVYLDTWVGKGIMLVAVTALVASKFTLLGTALKGLGSMILGVGKSILGIGSSVASVTPAMDDAVKQFYGMQKAANPAKMAPASTGLMVFAKGMLMFSVAALAFAGAVFVIASAFTMFALGVLVMVKAANELEDGAMGTLAIGLLELGAAMIGFSVMMMIASIFTALGIPAFLQLTALLAVLIATVPAVAPLMSTFAEGLIELGGAFRSFMASMAMESGSGIVNAIKGFFGMKSTGNGFFAFILLMNVLKKTLGSMPEGILTSISEFLNTIMTFTFASSPFKSMIESLKEMVYLLDNLPEEQMVSLTANMKSMGEASVAMSDFRAVVEAVGGITEDKVNLVSRVVESAKEYYTSAAEYSETKASTEQKKEEAVVTLEIDSRKVAEAVLPLIEGRLASKYFQDTLYD